MTKAERVKRLESILYPAVMGLLCSWVAITTTTTFLSALVVCIGLIVWSVLFVSGGAQILASLWDDDQ